MICIRSINALRLHIADEKRKSKAIGFVPTMGALHEGHISLIKQAKAENALCIASIFVNPLQFNNAEDFKKYPIQQEKDIQLMEQAGCDVLFIPSVEEFYPSPPKLSIDIGALDRILEGTHRPGHFSGVAIVVSKLFNVVSPDKAYFGQKDLQQVAVINQLVRELNFPIEIIACPIVREQNGLAMSSRNMRLSNAGKTVASNLFAALSLIKQSISKGERSTSTLVTVGGNYLNTFKEIEIEYLEVVNGDTLESITEIKGVSKVAVCIAAHIEGVRLIDNLVIIL
ncbi:pantoate--beta-alanine ligase [Cytophaga aurantiaca]|uniref:pantoate--beta-alanine ligase n=1 Tax=Cytophaga aurantiaca TaxID=29530 RepID=UPI0003710596|nr:pantoate--beta-alanine ligase [Cytophaga aurantiaca]